MTTIPTDGMIDSHYKIVRELGQGGMGAVFQAVEIDLERSVAIKLLHYDCSDENSRQRFRREGKILSTLSHPHILQFFRFGVWADRSYIAMEYFPGKSLVEVLRTEEMPVERCIAIASQVCDAMDYAHSRGVVHRDISPSNIMLQVENNDYVKVIDFGLSMFSRADKRTQQLTQTGAVLGSVYYMSPEQCRGMEATSAADVYSLGCVLYQMLSGEPPFTADNPIGLMHKHANDPPPPLAIPHMLPGLENVVMKALSKAPRDRHESMAAFKKELELVATGQGHSIPAVVFAGEDRKSGALLQTTALLLVGLLVLSIAVTAMFHGGNSRREFKAESAGVGEATNSSLRKLRSMQDLESRTPRERIDYYNSWLEVHGGRFSTDLVQAHFSLAKVLLQTKSPEAEQERTVASKLCKMLLDKSVAERQQDLCDQAVQMLIKLYEPDKVELVEGDIGACLNKMQHADGRFFVKAVNTCHRMLASSNYLKGNYQGALSHYDPVVASISYCSIDGVSRLHDQISRAACLRKLGRKDEARAQIAEAWVFAARLPKELDEQLRLIEECLQQREFKLCLDACERIEITLNGIECPLLNQIRDMKLACCRELQDHTDFFDTLAIAVNDSSDPLQSIDLWREMALINLKRKLHREDALLNSYGEIVDRVPKEADAALWAALLCQLRNIANLHIEQADTASAKTLLRGVQRAWPKCPKSDLRVLTPLIDLIRQLRSSGQGTEAQRLFVELTSCIPPKCSLEQTLWSEIAATATQQGDEKAALAALDQLVRLAEQDKSVQMQIWVLLTRERIIGRRPQHLKEGREWAETALRLAEENGLMALAVESKIDVAILDNLCKNYAPSVALLSESAALARDKKWVNSESRARNWLAQTFIVLGDNAKADAQGDQLVEISKRFPEIRRALLAQASDIFRRTKNRRKEEECKKAYVEAIMAIK